MNPEEYLMIRVARADGSWDSFADCGRRKEEERRTDRNAEQRWLSASQEYQRRWSDPENDQTSRCLSIMSNK